MTSIRVPENHGAALADLADRPYSSVQKLAGVLRKTGVSITRGGLRKNVSKAFPRLTETGAATLASALISAHLIRASREWSSDEASHQIAWSDSFDLPGPKRQALQKRLATLLEVVELYTLARAIDLVVESQRLFHGSRVITDVRNVFVEAEEEPVAAVIVHNLKIEYHEDENVRSIFVALDQSDLRRLSQTIDRALLKEAAIRALMDRSGQALISLEDS